jgi:hypothetical protein
MNTYRAARKRTQDNLLRWEQDLQRREAALQRPQPDLFKKGYDAGLRDAARAAATRSGDDTQDTGEPTGGAFSDLLKSTLGAK